MRARRRFTQFIAAAALVAIASSFPKAAAASKPNIVFILADDLGYGDVRAMNPGSKIPTPRLDRLAEAGIIFTDAHSSSAVCTPTRYGLLTGRYNWRSRLKRGVQGGMSPPLIEPGRLTVGSFLQQNGYHTACIGKWHLGMEWPLKPDAKPFTDAIEKGEDGWGVDFTKPIGRGPNSAGFDYYFGISASLDMVPYTFIENDRVKQVPTMDKSFPMMLGHPARTRRGPGAADFEAVDVLPELARHAISYIEQRANDAKQGRPFFLYLPLSAPHTATVPAPEWRGKSGLNAYGDFVMQIDAAVGSVLDALSKSGLETNTLVIFTSDNGCSPEAKYNELLPKGHNPSAQFRGTKADIFEGGHRVPLLARWPNRVKPGGRSDQLICLNDFIATCADALGQKLPENAAEDSVSFLPALEGHDAEPLRKALVHHSINGSFAIRQGSWKLALCPDSGGWSAPRPGTPAAKALPDVQLYDLAKDIGETNNIAAQHPEVVERLTKLLEHYVSEGRSTPGSRQTNTSPVQIRGAVRAAADGVPTYATNSIEGWTVLISDRFEAAESSKIPRALELLRMQLQEIVRAVPAPALNKLREVTLWFSPEYPGIQPRAEYHPDAGWLRSHGRDPAMARGVEFTDARIFEAETKRMPNFALHELAHAYHDRVLRFDNPEIKAAFERAKEGKTYDRVERWFGNGRPNTFEKAYAMTSPQEYFAECSEAFFSRNDFYPFTRDELARHDPEMFELLDRVWKNPMPAEATTTRK